MPGSRNAQKANYEQVMYLTKITFEVHTNKYDWKLLSFFVLCNVTNMLKILARIASGKPREVSTLLSRAYPFERDFSRYRLNTQLADWAIK